MTSSMPRRRRVVLALDKFKGSLTAGQAANALAHGLRAVLPDVEVDIASIADGGEGTVAVALSAGFRPVSVTVPGPVGDPVACTFAVRGSTAVIEMADACGMTRLPGGELRPLDASSKGAGVAVAAALDLGCTDVVMGVGGSASTDAGLGFLAGLGVRLLDSAGVDVPPGARELHRVHELDLTGLHPAVRHARIRIATDVDNPLVGPSGAVAVFGAQKGLAGAEASSVEVGLAQVAALLEHHGGTRIAHLPGAGAAGGVPAAAVAVLGAGIVSGADFVLELLQLDRRLDGAALVVTGEGSFDEQSLRGKGPAAVLAAASRAGVPACLVAGRIGVDPDVLRSLGVVGAWALMDRVTQPDDSIRRAAVLLREVGSEVAALVRA